MIKKNILFATNYYDNLTNIRDDYNLYNRGVDRMNQNMSYYSEYRKEYRWWKKIFLFMIGASCENSRILYNFLHPTNVLNNFDFRKELLSEIFDIYNDVDSDSNFGPLVPKKIREKLHSMDEIKGKSNICVYCHSGKTNCICIECQKSLHPKCFTCYHNQYIYNK